MRFPQNWDAIGAFCFLTSICREESRDPLYFHTTSVHRGSTGADFSAQTLRSFRSLAYFPFCSGSGNLSGVRFDLFILKEKASEKRER
jgi:hypothetical protein